MKTDAVPDEAFERLLEHVRDARGFDFTGYKRASLMRRTGKRMQEVGIQGYDAYVDYLEVHQEEFTELFNSILINVTSFFRDAPVWEYLGESVIPAICDDRGDAEIRVWCAGCASGEEAYSIAMLLAEHLGDEAFQDRVKIYATDVDDDAIATARHGVYPAKAADAIGPDRLERFFEGNGGTYAFRRDLRRSLIFGRHDLVQDAPIRRTDLVSCRNTLMYMNSETQARVLDHFRFSLSEDGFLLLGKSEMLFTRVRAFLPVDLKRRVFAKQGGEDRVDMRAWGGDGDEGRTQGRRAFWRAAFDEAQVPLLLVDADGVVVMANAKVRELFGLREDDVGKPLQDLELSYRPVELRAPIREALENRRPVQLRAEMPSPAGGSRVNLNIEISPLGSGDEPMGVSVSFVDVSEAKQLQQDLENSNQELETAMEELQSTNEELETTNEELQSTNEELETTNEELQSTNEELETMNEELQSTNEELETVNEELNERTSELAEVNSFMDSVLRGIGAGVVVLDKELRVQSWNAMSEELWGLRADEVRGQPFLNLDLGLPLDALKRQIRAAVDGDLEQDTIVVDAVNRRGRQVRCRVTCSGFEDERNDRGVILMMETEAATED